MARAENAEVLETKDRAIASEQESAGPIKTGEIPVSEASNSSYTRESESGKKIVSPSRLATRPGTQSDKDDLPVVTESNDPRKKTGQLHGKALSGEKIVPILVTTYLKCKIGPRWYEFQAGDTYHVPEVVKEVLKQRGVLGVV